MAGGDQKTRARGQLKSLFRHRPLWIICRNQRAPLACPLRSREQTSPSYLNTSAKRQKRRYENILSDAVAYWRRSGPFQARKDRASHDPVSRCSCWCGSKSSNPCGQSAVERFSTSAAPSGFKPRPTFIEFDANLITTVGSPLKWSMLRDIERGSTTDGEHILGDMVARARALGVKTPILNLARTRVAAYEIVRVRAAAS
jgi:hypothetical protein